MDKVKFLLGTEADYEQISPKVSTTFYCTESNLYLGEMKLVNFNDLSLAVGSLADLETETKDNLVAAINEVKNSAGGGGGTMKWTPF